MTMTSFAKRCLSLSILIACGGDDGGAPDTPDGSTQAACTAHDPVRLADAQTLHGLAFEAGAPRTLVGRTAATAGGATLVLVGDGLPERVLSTQPIASAALANRWDGAVCAAWIATDDTFHAACGPDWTEATVADVEQSHGRLALVYPTRSCGFGDCVDDKHGLALHSDVAMAAVVERGGSWGAEELFISSISFFGDALVVDGLPWACGTAPFGGAAIFGPDGRGDLDIVHTAEHASSTCRITGDGQAVYALSRGGSGGHLMTFVPAAGRPTVTSAALPFELPSASFDVVATEAGATIYVGTATGLQAATFDRAAGTFGALAPVAGGPTTSTSQVLAARVGEALELATVSDGGVWLARACGNR